MNCVDINSLPASTSLMVDANIVIYYLAGASQDCKIFFSRVAHEEIEPFVTTTIVAEGLHRRMVAADTRSKPMLI